jgi:hypothetical protein
MGMARSHRQAIWVSRLFAAFFGYESRPVISIPGQLASLPVPAGIGACLRTTISDRENRLATTLSPLGGKSSR